MFTVLPFSTPPIIVSPVFFGQPLLSFVFTLPLNAHVKLEFQQSLLFSLPQNVRFYQVSNVINLSYTSDKL